MGRPEFTLGASWGPFQTWDGAAVLGPPIPMKGNWVSLAGQGGLTGDTEATAALFRLVWWCLCRFVRWLPINGEAQSAGTSVYAGWVGGATRIQPRASR